MLYVSYDIFADSEAITKIFEAAAARLTGKADSTSAVLEWGYVPSPAVNDDGHNPLSASLFESSHDPIEVCGVSALNRDEVTALQALGATVSSERPAGFRPLKLPPHP